MPVDNNQPPEAIPSELINLKEIYERRFLRRKERFDDKQRGVANALEPLIAAHRKAVHSYEDHFDDCLLKYKRDLNKMPMDERDVREVKQARVLKRAVEDAEHLVRKKESELTLELKSGPEYQSLFAAQTEFEGWLAKVCIFLKCCPADLDWKERRITRAGPTCESVPRDLLIVPQV